MSRDFLNAPTAPKVEGAGMGEVLTALQGQTVIWEDIRRELMKQNADVLAFTRIDGSSPIASGDTAQHRVFFEIGGKTIVVYHILIYSTYTGSVYLSVNGLSNPLDGIPFASGDVLELDSPVESVYIMTDGSADCAINGPSDITNGGFFIYGFGISDFDRQRR
jgi:hypothetical protein